MSGHGRESGAVRTVTVPETGDRNAELCRECGEGGHLYVLLRWLPLGVACRVPRGAMVRTVLCQLGRGLRRMMCSQPGARGKVAQARRKGRGWWVGGAKRGETSQGKY